jgi:hypothetical protein
LDTIKLKNPKPQQKFFERYLNNDLDELSKYLLQIEQELVFGDAFKVPLEVQEKFRNNNPGASTALYEFYNIFNFENESVKRLKVSLADVTKEACDYYGINYYESDYKINGWFNVDYGSAYGNNPYTADHTEDFHDHMDGMGAPTFHGYYCVNAEPSSTFYLINQVLKFENINKNNRLIISETGHPHNIGNWSWEGPRITVAYDIVPKSYSSNKWVSLDSE